MREHTKQGLGAGILLVAFVIWTVLIQSVDVQCIGPQGSAVGFAAFNQWFHRLSGVHMGIYTVTDWLGLVPILICLCFGALGLGQWIRRRSLLQVDVDILLLGVYDVVVIFAYLFFEMVPINYRPVLINGVLEASYPSSTTLLVLSVMPTLDDQVRRRCTHPHLRAGAALFAGLFSAFMVLGRLISGVHWATDIIGAVLLSAGLFLLYRFTTGLMECRRSGAQQEGAAWNSTKNYRN